MKSQFFCLLLAGTVTFSQLAGVPFVVSNTSDSSPGSLRDAINDSNAATPGPNTITFSVAGTITPLTDLPTIIIPVTIDGTTAPGWSMNTNPITQANNANLTVEIRGPGTGLDLPGPLNGLVLGAGSDGSVIKGLVIDDFANLIFSTEVGGTGILIESTNNRIEGCFLGCDPTGTISRPCFVAILNNDDSNTVGGATPDTRNLLTGSYGFLTPDGNFASGTIVNFGSFSTIQGNTIGLDRSGTASLMLTELIGIHSLLNSDVLIQGNVISGHSFANMMIQQTERTAVVENTIGPDVSGSFGIAPSGLGVFLKQSLFNGPTLVQIDSNLISGNTYGIIIGENILSNISFTGVEITNNTIGLDSTGMFPLPNAFDGIWLKFAENTYVAGNISGNLRHGIRTGKSRNADIKNNIIGSDADGVLALGNGGDGIRLGTSGIGLQSFGDVIGGAKPGEGNLIAFNAGNGIKTLSFVEDETIMGNTIINNGKNGILIGPFAEEITMGMFRSEGDLRIIGDLASQGDTNLGPLGTSNIISGNGEDGVKIHRSPRNVVQTNIVTDNAGTGVKMKNASHNKIGGRFGGSSTEDPVLGNVVSDNGRYGVEVEERNGEAVDNAIISNSIFDNGRDGIELKQR